MYGDNVIEKHGINRDRTGDREKTRYLCGKQGIFTRDRALIRPGFIRQLETRASTRSASFFHALGSPGRPHNGGGAAGAYRTSNGAKPLKQGHLRAKRGPLGPSRKSQQQTKRTGFAAHGHSIAETAPEGKRASCANGALNRAKINGWGQKQGFGGSDRRAGSVTSRYSRRYDGGGDRAQARQNSSFAKGHFRQSRGDVSLCPYFLGFRGGSGRFGPTEAKGQHFDLVFNHSRAKKLGGSVAGLTAPSGAAFFVLAPVEICRVNRFFFLLDFPLVFEMHQLKNLLAVRRREESKHGEKVGLHLGQGDTVTHQRGLVTPSACFFPCEQPIQRSTKGSPQGDKRGDRGSVSIVLNIAYIAGRKARLFVQLLHC